MGSPAADHVRTVPVSGSVPAQRDDDRLADDGRVVGDGEARRAVGVGDAQRDRGLIRKPGGIGDLEAELVIAGLIVVGRPLQAAGLRVDVAPSGSGVVAA